jgi:hypothetical protein
MVVESGAMKVLVLMYGGVVLEVLMVGGYLMVQALVIT